ncbi:MAG TPA: hypothetical protein VJI13_06220 [Candidatus Norongarragalinales archaeon]|nr:hypothetical protein [Candidatus Norongarragalinales archaeon]
MDEVQEKIGVELEPPKEAAAVEKKVKGARKKRAIAIPKKEGIKMRLERFDFILLQLLKEGKTDVQEIRGIFNVGEAEFQERLRALGENGYLSISQDLKSVFLSMRGVNYYSPKWKKAADSWLGRKEKKTLAKDEKRVDSESQAIIDGSAIKSPDSKPVDFSHTIQAKLPVEILWKEIEQRHVQIQELPEEKRQEETIDIMDLMRRYGPTDEQKKLLKKTSPFVERHMPKKGMKAEGEEMTAPAERILPTAGQKPLSGPKKPFYNRVISEMSTKAAEIEISGEKCELCKTGFMISVKQEEHNPKYGHCFCGAPYHKDCFEAIIADDTKCVRCGRKLGGGGADFKVEEAFKQITDISY